MTLPWDGPSLGAMRAVVATEPGGPEVLTLGDVPTPSPGRARWSSTSPRPRSTALTSCSDRGFYPPPPGASDVIGLECSGTVAAVGEGVERWQVGDEVCALLAGGGYAEKVLCRPGR